MKMEGKRPRGRPKLRWKDTIRRDQKPGKSRRNGTLTEKNGKVSARPATPNRETAAKGEKPDHLSPYFAWPRPIVVEPGCSDYIWPG